MLTLLLILKYIVINNTTINRNNQKYIFNL